MDSGRGMILIFLIGFILPLGILVLVAVGYLIKFLWDIDEEVGCFRPIIVIAGITIVLLIVLFLGFAFGYE